MAGGRRRGRTGMMLLLEPPAAERLNHQGAAGALPHQHMSKGKERERQAPAEEGGLQQRRRDTPLSPLSIPHFQKGSRPLFLSAATDPSAKPRAQQVLS